jgi:hypothetical protein
VAKLTGGRGLRVVALDRDVDLFPLPRAAHVDQEIMRVLQELGRAGDAAHQTPPFLGQGMCSGIRDAANLSWKLERVVRGDAPDVLLDIYQAEREPQVRAIVGAAVDFGRIICTTDAAVAAESDAGMLAARAAGGGNASSPPAPTRWWCAPTATG